MPAPGSRCRKERLIPGVLAKVNVANRQETSWYVVRVFVKGRYWCKNLLQNEMLQKRDVDNRWYCKMLEKGDVGAGSCCNKKSQIGAKAAALHRTPIYIRMRFRRYKTRCGSVHRGWVGCHA